MKSNRILYTVLAIQSALLGYLLLGSAERSAVAQVPDQGAQLQRLTEETKAVNAKLDRVITVLESGRLQVVVAEKK